MQPLMDPAGQPDSRPAVRGHDYRDGGNGDIYVEATTADTLPGPDVVAPASPTAALATLFQGAFELSWVNPADVDFYRVRILRTSGASPPAGLDDTSASVVYEGNGTTFTDTDVVPGVSYSYAIYAFDYEPNFSVHAVASTG